MGTLRGSSTMEEWEEEGEVNQQEPWGACGNK